MAPLDLFENFRSLLSENFDFLYLRINGYQLILDAFLLVLFLYVFFRKSNKRERPMTSEEISDLVDSWEPEPLIAPRNEQMELDAKIPTISGTTSTHVTIDGKQALNLARTNFLGMICHPKVEEAATNAIHKYGTGTCGPRGFYGSLDIHIDLEERIKNFLDVEDCVLYSFGFSTISSVIPAFSSRGDILVVDKGSPYSIQSGAKISRAEIMWYEHGDMKDLERVLQKVIEKDKQTKRTVTRRYIIFEGVCFNYGDIAPLPKILELAQKYKFRTIMDDSFGIGVIGKTGRGTCEHYGISPRELDILTGNLASVTSSVGGFSCAAKPYVFHQRLNSSAYVFSASLPPLLAAASIAAFDVVEESPNLLTQLISNTEILYKGLSDIEGFKITNQPNCGILHLRVEPSSGDRFQDEQILQQLVDQSLEKGVLLTRAKYVHSKETFLPPPSIRLTVSAVNTKEQLNDAVKSIKAAAAKISKQRK